MRDACGLERVLFVPTREGKHYRDGAMSAPAEQRAQMIRLAIAANAAFALDESDLAPDASGYTADLLPRLRARYPDAAFTFIVGGDSLVRSQLAAAGRGGRRGRGVRRRAARDGDAATTSTPRWPTSTPARRAKVRTARPAAGGGVGDR